MKWSILESMQLDETKVTINDPNKTKINALIP